MKKNIQIFNMVCLLVLITKISYAQMTTSQIAKEFSKSVITIISLDQNDQPLNLGSGFVINNKGDIVTNSHVLKDCSKAIIKTIKGQKANVIEIIKYNFELDLIVAKTSLKNIEPLSLGDSDTITIGEDVIAIGNPAGLEGTISKGIISGIRKTENSKYIQITAPISPGSSGGPVFNSLGKVIGIATSYLDNGQNLNFAMPINYIKTLNKKILKLPFISSKNKKNNIEKNNSLVKAFDIHYISNFNYEDIKGIDFSIKNLSNYPIKNIQLFFIYYNYNADIISYSTEKIKKMILPKLALQFHHFHLLNHFRKGVLNKKTNKFEYKSKVEIRILDYEIIKTSNSSPTDLLFK